MTWMSSLTNSYGFDLHGEPVPQRRLGIYFHGVNGTMYADYGMFKIVPEGDKMKDLAAAAQVASRPRPATSASGSTASSRVSSPVAASSTTRRSMCRSC